MGGDGEFWRQVKANHQAEYLRISDPANSLLSYSIDGESMDWTGYKRYLLEQIAFADQQIAVADPWEIEQRGVT